MTAFIERKFALRNGKEVILRLFAPQPGDMDWECETELTWPDRQIRRKLFGIDGIQALLIAMHLAQVELQDSPEYAAGELTWLEQNRLGLPTLDAFKI